jgi:hypothetical protein
MARYRVTLSLYISTTRRPTPGVALEHVDSYLECIRDTTDPNRTTYSDDEAQYVVDRIAFDGLEPGVDDCDEGNICGGKGWIISTLNARGAEGRPHIEACAACEIMTDAEAQAQPAAKAALRRKLRRIKR